jgi:hypothetical protein
MSDRWIQNILVPRVCEKSRCHCGNANDENGIVHAFSNGHNAASSAVIPSYLFLDTCHCAHSLDGHQFSDRSYNSSGK